MAKEITILSGKGGTGKTTITAALASLMRDAVYTDCDVDAADMHLLLDPEILESHTFESGSHAVIDKGLCTACGLCEEACRFDAISVDKNGSYAVDPFLCEGCRLCERICPAEAITSNPSMNNFWYVSNTRFGKLVHAHMGPGEENSGKLVAAVRKKAREIARAENLNFIVNDGPPGIGCPVISSLTGVDLVLMVIEPSKSGMHDIIRLSGLTEKFNIPSIAIINKYDLNENYSVKIAQQLTEAGIELVGLVPFDKAVVEAMVAGKTITEYSPTSIVAKEIDAIREKVFDTLVGR